MKLYLPAILNWIALTLWLLWACYGIRGLPYATEGEELVAVGMIVLALLVNTPVVLLKKRSQPVDFVKTVGIISNSLLLLGLLTGMVASIAADREWIDLYAILLMVLALCAPATTIAAIVAGRGGQWWERVG